MPDGTMMPPAEYDRRGLEVGKVCPECGAEATAEKALGRKD
jgi:hypothetical protein